MADITDQDRRLALRWCDMLGDSTLHKEAAATRRVILATVDAPAPTLAERLMEQFYYPEHTDEQGGIILDAQQMERDLEEARAEVERLTAERTSKESLQVDQTDPADVKPGEAWIVEVNGERRTAVKDRLGAEPWNTVPVGGRFWPEENGSITLVSRLVPAPRVITDPDDLNRAKRLTVIRDGVGVVCERAPLGDGWFTTGNGVDQTPYIKLPATVLWEPEA